MQGEYARDKRRRWPKRVLAVLCVLWILVIWHFSLMEREVSGETSGAVRDVLDSGLQNLGDHVVDRAEPKPSEQPSMPTTPDEGPAEPTNKQQRAARFQEWTQRVITFVNQYIRKAAHVAEYFLLGALVCFTLYAYGLRLGVLWALPMPVIVGAIDEGLQSFTPGRSASFSDVLLDSAGGACGIAVSAAIVLLVCFVSQHKKRKKIQKTT